MNITFPLLPKGHVPTFSAAWPGAAHLQMELITRFELVTSSLPNQCSKHSVIPRLASDKAMVLTSRDVVYRLIHLLKG